MGGLNLFAITVKNSAEEKVINGMLTAFFMALIEFEIIVKKTMCL